MKKPFILVSVAAALILLLGTAARLLGYVNTPPQPREPQRFDAVSELSDFEAGLREYVSDNAEYIRKIYKIPAGELPPEPNSACYGETTDPQEVQAVIDAAAELLDGQETIWSPDIDFAPKSVIRYYRDDTILVIAWQEAPEGRGCSFVEVKLADASQLRRKVSGEYGSQRVQTATALAAEDNAVIAISGDFYLLRSSYGIAVYKGNVEHCYDRVTDTCFVTEGGDLLVHHRGGFADEAEARKFVEDNNVDFSLIFGPILVENGELQDISPSYPVGEVGDRYSRSAIGQRGELHYLLMTVCFEQNYGTCTAYDEARFMHAKGLDVAYALDGGHTATITMGGRLYNRPDWGEEKQISDVICFASAMYD